MVSDRTFKTSDFVLHTFLSSGSLFLHTLESHHGGKCLMKGTDNSQRGKQELSQSSNVRMGYLEVALLEYGKKRRRSAAVLLSKSVASSLTGLF